MPAARCPRPGDPLASLAAHSRGERPDGGHAQLRGGAGLGLSVAYGTVQAHGGTLDLWSRPGEGTEVILGFPPRCTRVSAASKALVAEAAPPVDSLRILLVDDDELIRLSVGPMLEMGGSDVVTVEGGAQALARFEEGEFPDLVLLDMNMP
ncbi:MAG TPA: response regulator, partial [Holophagaceae bacterium]